MLTAKSKIFVRARQFFSREKSTYFRRFSGHRPRPYLPSKQKDRPKALRSGEAHSAVLPPIRHPAIRTEAIGDGGFCFVPAVSDGAKKRFWGRRRRPLPH